MSHSHALFDRDNPFKIEPLTRNITIDSNKLKLMQHDHNSERFTFEVPRYVEGHDLMDCNVIEVHYLNIESNTRKTNEGVYTVDDKRLKDDDEDTLVCSWLVSSNATQLVGQLSFLIRFSCVLDNGTVEYAWNTGIFSGIIISSGIYNTDAVEQDCADILKAWETELKSNQVVSLEQTERGVGSNANNVWKATFGDGRTSEFVVKNGETGLIGSIETTKGDILRFFVGTKAEYDTLSNADKQSLFAIITDDEDYIGKPANMAMLYNRLDDIIDESCTTEELMLKMLPNSSVAVTVNTRDMPITLTDMPFKNAAGDSYGYVVLWKGWTNNYCYGIAWDIYGSMYFYKYHTGTSLDTNGWHKFFGIGDVVPRADTARYADTAGNAYTANASNTADVGNTVKVYKYTLDTPFDVAKADNTSLSKVRIPIDTGMIVFHFFREIYVEALQRNVRFFFNVIGDVGNLRTPFQRYLAIDNVNGVLPDYIIYEITSAGDMRLNDSSKLFGGNLFLSAISFIPITAEEYTV